MLSTFVKVTCGSVSYTFARQGPTTQEVLPPPRVARELLAIQFLQRSLRLNQLLPPCSPSKLCCYSDCSSRITLQCGVKLLSSNTGGHVAATVWGLSGMQKRVSVSG